MSVTRFNSTFDYKLIYIFRINDVSHKGCLKIGDATLHTNKLYTELSPNSHELNYAARERIDSYTVTAGTVYELLYTEIAVYNEEQKKGVFKKKAFRDYNVHDVLKRSGIKIKCFDTNKKQNEWFETDLETAKLAIKAVKEGKTSLNASQISSNQNPIIFRPEQKEAIRRTIARFKNDTKMLWNAKMRFGKTLSALQVAKEMKFKRTIIITHRPVVSDGWFEDFEKIFYDKKEYFFGSKTRGKTIEDLIRNDDYFVYFASMQDLRGSDIVGGNFDKNNEIFKIDWDFVVVDEAHEGTKTELGKNVLKAVIKEESDHETYILELSGTPFNLLTDFEKESIYTWDYIMEQEAKENWFKNHFGDSNPYEELPRMNIYTYHLEKSLPAYVDVMDKAFNFREFFRIWTGDVRKDGKQMPKGINKGTFVHEEHIKQFLDLICKKDENTNYPFSTNEYRSYFRHSLWVVPGVKEAKALAALLRQHHIFKHFKIVNVAGDGDEEIDTSDAKNAVEKAISSDPENTYTITLSCGRLTTGVSIKAWTAVLMLAGTYSTAASQYLQTIFRVQTPANIDGKIKEECFVFDFAPDRTLKMIAESVQLSARAGSSNPIAEVTLRKFLNFCPVIAIEESNMKEYKVAELLQELKKAYAERVARNGFDDPKIYNDELLKLTKVELNEFENLKRIVGASNQTKKVKDIDINKEGFSAEENEREKELEKKPKKELTPEEKAELEALKEKKKNRDSAISILRAISIRMPLLVYGMNIDIETDVTIDNFADLVDNTSWEEFMPKGVEKEMFKKFSKYYDKDIFIAASRRIRFIAKTADELEPTERVQKIASLFATFKNPDKETVLTPWRVVNLHISDTIGGWDFFNEKHESELIDGPRFVDRGDVTKEVFNSKSKILEINSKTGLYPLYVTYSIYREKTEELGDISFGKKYEIWDEILDNQIYVICKTPMAKQITKRTLLGYRNGKTNMHAFDDLIMQLKDKPDKFIEKVTKKSFWGKGDNEKMKFNAVVGNPPYQLQGGSGGSNDSPIYQYFVETINNLSPNYSSLIIPARWGAAGRENLLGEFRKNMLRNEHIKKLFLYADATDIFTNVEIKGGICYYLIDLMYKGFCDYTYVEGEYKEIYKRNLAEFDLLIRDPHLAKIVSQVKKYCEGYGWVDSIISYDTPFGISSNVKSSTKKTIEVVEKKDNKHSIAIYHIEKQKRKKEYISEADVVKNMQDISKYKVLLTGAAGSGNDPYVLGKPIIADQNSVCSQSYLYVAFDDLIQANNFVKYLKTKTFRALVASIKTTQSCPNRVYKYVPLFNFSNYEIINWNLSIQEIDNQLFKLFEMDVDSIAYIKNRFKYFED